MCYTARYQARPAVALAEALDVHLLTDDAKFAATSGHNANIHIYPDGADDE